jgi:hypothetical protein
MQTFSSFHNRDKCTRKSSGEPLGTHGTNALRQGGRLMALRQHKGQRIDNGEPDSGGRGEEEEGTMIFLRMRRSENKRW